MAEDRKPSPAYVSYATFKSTIRAITHNKKPPTRIDASVLSKMSGSGKFQFLNALRFLYLIDADGKPSQPMEQLCAADDAMWKAVMSAVLLANYEPQLAALKDGTPKTFRESFGDVGASIITPAMRFLHAAAKDCGLPISPHIKEIADTRSQRRPADKPSGKLENEVESKASQSPSTSLMDKLLEKFPEFDPTWDDATQTKWFAMFEKFVAMTGKGAPTE